MKITELHREAWVELGKRRAQLPHALLLSGQRGNGKFDLALAFARALLCEASSAAGADNEHVEACGACPACVWLAQGNHPDFRLLQPEALASNEGEGETEASGKKKPSQQITIGQVRALDAFLHVGTHRDGVRVIVVNPAEAMNRATANSLLKSLEEPIAGTVFLLVTSEAERLLPTIRSRCQSVAIAQAPAARAEAWLATAGVEDSGRWLALAGGAPLLAIDLASSDENALVAALVAELSRGGAVDAIAAAAVVDRWLKSANRPAPLKRALEWVQKWLVDLMLAREGLPLRYFLGEGATLRTLAKAAPLPQLLAFNKKTLQYRLQCEQPLNSRLFLETLFLDYAICLKPSPDPRPAAHRDRVFSR